MRFTSPENWLKLAIVKVEFTVLAGLQPRTVHRIEIYDGFVEIEKFGVRNSERTALGGQLFTRQDPNNPQLSSTVASHE